MDTVKFNAQAVNTYWIIARAEADRDNDARRVALLDGIHDTAAAALNGDTVIITDTARRTALDDGHRYITHQARTALTR